MTKRIICFSIQFSQITTANITSTAVISLVSSMNAIELTPDQKVAKIGPGNIWYNVYSTLEKLGLTVVGGRVADIGVGGLTLGGEIIAVFILVLLANSEAGGISFFSGAYGWGCDNVVNYEVCNAA